MAYQTGRTVNRYVDFRIDDSAGTLRSIPVDSINGLDLNYEEFDVTAFHDAVKGKLLGIPDLKVEISGPFDTTAAAAAGTLSGSHTVLNGIKGKNVPLTMDIQVGIGHPWEAGEPQFGITSSATVGMLCQHYAVDVNTGKYSASFVVFPGSTLPDWGTTAES